MDTPVRLTTRPARRRPIPRTPRVVRLGPPLKPAPKRGRRLRRTQLEPRARAEPRGFGPSRLRFGQAAALRRVGQPPRRREAGETAPHARAAREPAGRGATRAAPVPIHSGKVAPAVEAREPPRTVPKPARSPNRATAAGRPAARAAVAPDKPGPASDTAPVGMAVTRPSGVRVRKAAGGVGEEGGAGGAVVACVVAVGPTPKTEPG